MTDAEKIIQRLKTEEKRFGIVLNSPASEKELADFKDELGIDLPSDILDFYKQCNGFESDDYMFRIIPLKEIIENRREFESGTFNLAEYLIYSDTWDSKLNKDNSKIYKIVNCNHKTEEPTEIFDSLYSFLDKYLTGTGLFGEQGLYIWANEIKASK
jgi:hypothetical protein